MPDASDTGFIINKYPYSETSLVVVWLSKSHGVVSTVARGVFKQNSLFFGKIDLFYLASFEFRINTKSDLHTLRDLSLIETFPRLRTNLVALNRASYSAYLIQRLVERGSPIPELFDQFHLLLSRLIVDNSVSPLIQFEILILFQVGELNPYDNCGHESKIFIQKLLSSGKIVDNLKLNNKMLGELHTLILKSLPENEQLMKLRRTALQDI